MGNTKSFGIQNWEVEDEFGSVWLKDDSFLSDSHYIQFYFYTYPCSKKQQEIWRLALRMFYNAYFVDVYNGGFDIFYVFVFSEVLSSSLILIFF